MVKHWGQRDDCPWHKILGGVQIIKWKKNKPSTGNKELKYNLGLYYCNVGNTIEGDFCLSRHFVQKSEEVQFLFCPGRGRGAGNPRYATEDMLQEFKEIMIWKCFCLRKRQL